MIFRISTLTEINNLQSALKWALFLFKPIDYKVIFKKILVYFVRLTIFNFYQKKSIN